MFIKLQNEAHEEFFNDKTVLITGGLGFIGSNLARLLLSYNPKRIIVVDSLIPEHGSNPFNLSDISEKISIFSGDEWDIRNQARMETIINEVDYIFNFAGSVSHIDSHKNPGKDLDLNLRAHVLFLEAIRNSLQKNPGKKLKIVFAGTRDVYGKVNEEDLPVHEDVKIINPSDPQGINNYATEFYHFWYAKNFGFDAVSLRLTNTYGPYHCSRHPNNGFLNWFIRLAIENKEIEIWQLPDGETALRDFNHVDDVANALVKVMISSNANNKAYNLGSYIKKKGRYYDVTDSIKNVKELAHLIVEIAGSGTLKEINYPPEKILIEPGHFCADATKIFKEVGWEPKISLQEGLKRTIDFYKQNKHHYWKQDDTFS